MTTLCIDELSARLKNRWGWSAAATHVPIDGNCPLLGARLERLPPGTKPRPRPALPSWLEPKRGHDGPPGISQLHGKVSPSMG